MTINIDATYENGVLRLDKPVPLNERARVHVSIRPVEQAAEDDFESVIGICDAGPATSLAERHDQILYGVKPASGEQR